MSKKSIKRLLLITITLILLSSCIHIELPHNGIVIDHETKKPIENVVVNMHIGSRELLGTSVQDDAYEATTANNGKYHLPLKIKFKGIVEFFTTQELYFHKAGYFTARILEPGISEEIELHRVKYLSDFRKYQKEAERNFSLYFIDEHKVSSQKFIKEMAHVSNTSAYIKGEPAFFSEMPNAIFTKVFCGTYSDWSPYIQHSETFAVNSNTCSVYDKASQKWFKLTPQGQYIPTTNKIPNNYEMFIRDRSLNLIAFANSSSVDFPKTYTDSKSVKAQIGNITSITGSWTSLLSIEDNGNYVCNYSFHKQTTNSCMAMSDISKKESNRMILLSKFYESAFDELYGIAKTDNKYVLYKISNHDEHGDSRIKIDEINSIPLDDELVGFLTTASGQSFFIQFKNAGMKRYYVDNSDKNNIVFGEYKEFNNKFRNLAFANNVSDYAYGPDGMLYIVTGDSKVYRIFADGSPDFIIETRTP